MTEVKVLVDGKAREIRGVNEDTSCESIILVLAKAAGKTGKVALLERWREFERVLPQDELLLSCLQSWGAFKHEVSFILQDEKPSRFNHLNKTSIKATTDDKRDIIKRSLDRESQENLTAFQQRKLQRLARAIEILDLQSTCWQNNEEAFLYLTEEEIVEELSVKLAKALKLQAKELVELETWEQELQTLTQTRENLSKQREIFSDKISKLDEQIAEANDAIEMLLEEVNETESVETSRRDSQSALDREEIDVLTRKVFHENGLFRKQDLELRSINSSVLELDTAIQSRNNTLSQLVADSESFNEEFNMSENFLPKKPEVESTKCCKTSGNISFSENEVDKVDVFENNTNRNNIIEERHANEEMKTETKMKQKKISNIDDVSVKCQKESFHTPKEDKRSLLDVYQEKAQEEPKLDTSTISSSDEDVVVESLEKVDSTSVQSQKQTKNTLITTMHTSNSSAKKPFSKSLDVYTKRKESFKKIRDVFEKQSTVTNTIGKDATLESSAVRSNNKPLTLPKPARGNILPPKLDNMVLPLEENWSNTENRDYTIVLTKRKPRSTADNTSFRTQSRSSNGNLSNIAYRHQSKPANFSSKSIEDSNAFDVTGKLHEKGEDNDKSQGIDSHCSLPSVNGSETLSVVHERSTSREWNGTINGNVNSSESNAVPLLSHSTTLSTSGVVSMSTGTSFSSYDAINSTYNDSPKIMTNSLISTEQSIQSPKPIMSLPSHRRLNGGSHALSKMEAPLSTSNRSTLNSNSTISTSTSSLSHRTKQGDSNYIKPEITSLLTNSSTKSSISTMPAIPSLLTKSSSLSHSQSSSKYLSPPTVRNNTRHSKKDNIVINNSDFAEQGVFV